MPNNRKIEKDFQHDPVTIATNGVAGSGVLSLAGKQTVAKLVTSRDAVFPVDDIGWFDLMLARSNEAKVLLHNALVTRTSYGGAHAESHEHTIYPNVVVLGAEHIGPDNMVREISFTAKGLEDIFYYDLVEWQPMHKQPAEVSKALKSMRNTEKLYKRKYERFSPESVYLLHQIPQVARFRVKDRVYEIFHGHSAGADHRSVAIKPIVSATIRFDNLTTIDEALTAAWAWRRFFTQITMQPMPFKTIRCKRSRIRRSPFCDLYLPNFDYGKKRKPIESFWPRYVPYGDWKNRKKFAAVMQKWLEVDEERQVFRARLERVLHQMEKETSPRLVAALCNAIEGLPELKKTNPLPKAHLKALVEGAMAGAKKAKVNVEQDRIMGLIALLQHTSLPQRLNIIAKEISQFVPDALAKQAIKHALQLRTFEAHGDRWDDTQMAITGPTQELLASICVIWDQSTCGMPLKDGERSLFALAKTKRVFFEN